MAHASPLNPQHHEAEASFLMYGAPSGGGEVVETFGELEAEYAAIRKACALIDCPHRAIIRVTGDDRLEFLNQMLTQELKDLAPYRAVRTFWLGRTGRIDADLRLLALDDHFLIDVDILATDRLLETLGAYIITEDVELTDVTDRMHRLELHGPSAAALLAAVSTPVSGPPIADLAPEQGAVVAIGEHHVTVERHDLTGEIGLHLAMDVEHMPTIYNQLVERGADAEGERTFRLRTAGWHAYNIARIEAGTPLYNLDFGPDSLPHETGVLRDRVSFTKGCYLGQEVVARIESRGHPKQTLVALQIDAAGHEDPHWQPTTGAPIVEPDAPEDAKPIGAVTSSTRSPMLGDAIACFAQLKWDHTKPDSAVEISTARGRAKTTVRPTLRFWPKA